MLEQDGVKMYRVSPEIFDQMKVELIFSEKKKKGERFWHIPFHQKH